MELTEEQRKRIEENRKKALLIRHEKSKSRATVQPYEKYKINLKNNKYTFKTTLHPRVLFLSYTCQILMINNFCLRPVVHQSKVDKSHQITVAGQSYVDTEAGFLLNEDNLSDTNKPV